MSSYHILRVNRNSTKIPPSILARLKLLDPISSTTQSDKPITTETTKAVMVSTHAKETKIVDTNHLLPGMTNDTDHINVTCEITVKHQIHPVLESPTISPDPESYIVDDHYITVILLRTYRHSIHLSPIPSFKYSLVSFYLVTDNQQLLPKFIIPDTSGFTYRKGIRQWLKNTWKIKKSNIREIKHLDTHKNHHVYLCLLQDNSPSFNIPFCFHTAPNSDQQFWKDLHIQVPYQSLEKHGYGVYLNFTDSVTETNFKVTDGYAINFKTILTKYGQIMLGLSQSTPDKPNTLPGSPPTT